MPQDSRQKKLKVKFFAVSPKTRLVSGMAVPWRVEKIAIFEDNFVFVIHNEVDAILVDPGEASAVVAFLKKAQLNCRMILITHHHADHVMGVSEISNKYSCPVYGPLKNQDQLLSLVTDWLKDGDRINFQDLHFTVFEWPGHTLGHLAFWCADQKWLFSGDVIFSLGCGRLFEGSFEQMFGTLQKLKSLPAATQIFCTHDYFPANQRFCQYEKIPIEGYRPEHPLILEQEKKYNPFLKAATVEEFQSVRERRNQF